MAGIEPYRRLELGLIFENLYRVRPDMVFMQILSAIHRHIKQPWYSYSDNMIREIPEDINEFIEHFANRTKAYSQVKSLAEELKNLQMIDFNDSEKIEIRAKLLLNLTEKQYEAGLLPE